LRSEVAPNVRTVAAACAEERCPAIARAVPCILGRHAHLPGMALKSDRVVALIGIFKLIKAALLIALGIAGLAAVPSDLAHRARHAIAWMGISPGRHTLSHLLGKLGSFDGGTARKLAVASLCYAAIFLVEGIGLLSKQRWAEWLTVGVTASFIPIEIYEAVEHFGPGKIVALILNFAILIYLVWRRIAAGRSLRHRLGRVVGYKAATP
jgi:uncharacterized membrane protein (DUF2068 family)